MLCVSIICDGIAKLFCSVLVVFKPRIEYGTCVQVTALRVLIFRNDGRIATLRSLPASNEEVGRNGEQALEDVTCLQQNHT